MLLSCFGYRILHVCGSFGSAKEFYLVCQRSGEGTNGRRKFLNYAWRKCNWKAFCTYTVYGVSTMGFSGSHRTLRTTGEMAEEILHILDFVFYILNWKYTHDL